MVISGLDMRGSVCLAMALAASAATGAGAGRHAVSLALHGRVDQFLVESGGERLREAAAYLAGRPALKPGVVLVDLHTGNGSAALTIRLADAIADLRAAGLESVALVHGPGSPATTLLALACDRLYMAEGSGLAAVDPGAFEPAGSAAQGRVLLDALRRYSKHRPRLAALYEGFVEPAGEVHAVELEGRGGQTAFYDAEGLARVRAEQGARIVRSERVAASGVRVALTAAGAARVGLSAGTLATAGAVATRLGVAGRDLRPLPPAGKAPKAAAAPAPARKPALKPVGTGDTVVVVLLHGAVGNAWMHALERHLMRIEALDPALVVFEIDTLGGGVGAALDISRAIFEMKKPRTVAYVNHKAISAGAIVSIACDEIVMQRGGVIGASQAVTGLPGQMKPVASEKLDSMLRAQVSSYCEGKFPSALVMAMITQELEVVEAVTADGRKEYMLGSEWENLTAEERERFVSHKTIDDANRLMTMNNQQALDRGFSRATVGGRREVLALYGLADHKVVTLDITWSEGIVRVLDALGPVLLVLGILGIIAEMKTPGFGVFGIAGVTLVSVFFLGKYVAGLAEMWEIALFALGVGLLAVELFVTPGFGVLGVAGILCMMSSLVLSLQSFGWPDTPFEWRLFERNLATVGGVVVATFISLVLVARHLHKVPYVGRLVLASPPASTAPTAVAESVSPMPSPAAAASRAAALVGRRGRATSLLRPAGRGEFDGEPLDVVTEGDFIHPGEPIEICQVRGNRVVVRRVP